MAYLKYLALLICTLFYLTSTHSQEWVLQNPFNKLGDINDIEIDASGKGYAVGEEAIILVTDNFGEVWEGKKSASAGVIWTVHIVKNTVAQVALAGGFRLERTEDGGDTWESVGGSLINITGIHSVDESIVYISTLQKGILKSTDGGMNWTPTGAPNNVGYDDVYFKDEMNGWVLAGPNGGDQIWSTQDGGDTWQAFDSIYQFINKIDFATDQIGYVSSSSGVIKTTNGGDTWAILPDSPDKSTDMFVLDENTLWITWGLTSQFTTDGGVTWSDRISTGFGGNMEGVFMLNQDQVWMTSKNVTIGYSEDMGATWEDQIPANKADIKSIKFVNEKIGYAAGSKSDNDFILRTLDAGAVWEPIKIGENLIITDMDIFGAANLVIGARKGAYITFDDGATLNPIPNFETKWVESVDYINNDNIFLGTINGEIIKTDTGGNNITVQTSSTRQISSISMANELKGWATTLDKQILYTNDGGQSWGVQFTGTEEMEACLALTEQKAFAAPDFGNYIMMTEDGGQNWNQISVPNSTFWGDFTFMDQDTGWLAGGSSGAGWILITRDGGFNWELDIRTNTAFKDIAAPIEGRQLVWAAGVGGQIMRFSECNTDVSLSNLQAPSVICEGVSNVVSVDFEGVDIFEWTIPAGWKVLGSNTSAQINLEPGANGGEVTVTGFNSCGDGTDTLSINLPAPMGNPVPAITEDNMVLTSENNGAGYQWFKDGILIEGANNQTFTATESGDYYVVVEYASGCASPPSNIITVISSGIVELAGEMITLYPNPAYTNFRIEGGNDIDAVSIFDYSGSLVKSYGKESQEYSLLNVPSGLYLVKILKGNDAALIRLVVQK